MIREDLLKKYEFIVNTSKEFMTLISRDYVYEAANDSYCRAHNRTSDQVVGKTVAEIWGGQKSEVIKGYIQECFQGRVVHYESWFEFPALGLRCFEVYCYPYQEKGTTTHMVVVSRDITERKQMEEKVFVDPLTGLFNYRYMNQRLEEEFERARRYNLSLPMLFADIDLFKDVNDNLGHFAGNEVLVHMANIFSNSTEKSISPTSRLRKADIIARFGGEEFVVLLPETSKQDAMHIAERIRNTVENYNFPHYAENSDIRITVSIGVAAFPDDDIDNPGDLLKKADLAMYDAKHKGRNKVSTYSE
jgi:diguanylate cyclase (GGDEF)-like protein/PAS domain S-box-containing protein